MTTEELAQKMVSWLNEQPGVYDAEVLDTDHPPFGADPAGFLGKAFIGFYNNGVPMSLEMAVTE